MNIDLPEVAAMSQNARFFRKDDRDYVEISFVGSKDTNIHKVKPEHMAKFREEWNAYCDGTPMKQRAGTPLTSLDGMDEQRAQIYTSRNVHNMEELAVLSDAQCQALGHGTLTLRKAAQEFLSLKAATDRENSRNAVVKASASVGSVPAEKYASESDLAAVKAQLGELSANVAALVGALQTPKRGRPPKPKTKE